MRGQNEQQLGVFSYISPEQRIPHDHPLGQLRVMADEALRDLRPRFNRLYAKWTAIDSTGEAVARIAAPSAVLRARERMLMEQLDYSLLYGWVCRTEHG